MENKKEIYTLDGAIAILNGRKYVGILQIFQNSFSFTGKVNQSDDFDVCNLQVANTLVDVPGLFGTKKRPGVTLSIPGKNVYVFAMEEPQAGLLVERVTDAAETEKMRRIESAYQQACGMLEDAKIPSDVVSAQCVFEKLGAYKESANKCSQCIEKKKELDEKERIYTDASELLLKAETIAVIDQTFAAFRKISGYRDADSKMKECVRKRENIQSQIYESAVATLNKARTLADIDVAEGLFSALDDYRDAKNKVEACGRKRADFEKKEIEYQKAYKLLQESENAQVIQQALEIFAEIWDYRDADTLKGACVSKIEQINAERYEAACQAMKHVRTVETADRVLAEFTALGDYQDAPQKAKSCQEIKEEIIKWSQISVAGIAEAEKKEQEKVNIIQKMSSKNIKALSFFLDNPYRTLGISSAASKDTVLTTSDKLKKLQRIKAVASYRGSHTLRHFPLPERELSTIQNAVTQTREPLHHWLWFRTPEACVCWHRKDFQAILGKPVCDADDYDIFLAVYLDALITDPYFEKGEKWDVVFQFIHEALHRKESAPRQAVLNHSEEPAEEQEKIESFKNAVVAPFEEMLTRNEIHQVIGLYSAIVTRSGKFYVDFANRIFSSIVAWLEGQESALKEQTKDKKSEDPLNEEEQATLRACIDDYVTAVHPNMDLLLNALSDNTMRTDIIREKFDKVLWPALLLLCHSDRETALHYANIVYRSLDDEHRRYARNTFGFVDLEGAEDDATDRDWDVMGDLYRSGRSGHVKDEAEAVKWYHKAAEADNKDALNSLGVCYCDGIGVEQDFKMACECYRRAADLGNPMACYNLALRYIKGEGVPVDDNKAESLLIKAKEGGVGDAQELIDDIRRKKRKGIYMPIIRSIEDSRRSGDIRADNINQQIQNGIYRCFEMIEVITHEFDVKDIAGEVINAIRQDFRSNDIRASNIYQQMHAGANAVYHMLTILMMLMDEHNLTSDIRKSLDDTLRRNDYSATTIHQQIVNCMYRSVEALGIIAAIANAGGVYKSAIDSVENQFRRQELSASNTNQQMANAGYRMFDYLEIIARSMDKNDSYASVIRSCRSDLDYNDIRANNIYGQVLNGWYRSFDLLSIIARINN